MNTISLIFRLGGDKTSQARGRVSNLNLAEVVLFLQSIGFDNHCNIRHHKECIQRVGIFLVGIAGQVRLVLPDAGIKGQMTQTPGGLPRRASRSLARR